MNKKILSLLLCLTLLLGLFTPVMAEEQSDGTVIHTVTVNYIYESNNTMVAQPYSAAVSDGADFVRSIAVPPVQNYSITADSIAALPEGVRLTDGEDGQTLNFALTAVTANVTIDLYYRAGSASYTVKHWQQNLEDDEYTLTATATLTGAIDAYTAAVENLYPGFICSGVTQSIISANNTTEVNIYYDRNYAMVTFDPNGGIGGPDPIYAKYGTQYDVGSLSSPTRAGYNFLGWDPAPSGTVSDDVTYTAQWEAASPTANLSVVLWGENANDEGYSYQRTVSVSVPTEATLSWNTSDTPLCENTQAGHHHTDRCYQLSALTSSLDRLQYTYDHADTVTVAPDGSSVLNVYFNRTTFTLTFRAPRNNGGRPGNSTTYGTITAKWGSNIDTQFRSICTSAGGTFWSEYSNAGSPWTNHIEIMPDEGITYYYHKVNGTGSSTMTYYGEVLPGGTGTVVNGGVNYDVIYTLTFNDSNYSVSKEDQYEFEGFTYHNGTSLGSDCDGATFYYSRNSYNLEFHNGSVTEMVKTPKYQQSLASFTYTPTAPPAGVESDAVFTGWYQNPECTGSAFNLAAYTMPSHHIALYAKWVNRSFTVSTYTDSTLEDLYAYEGYDGSQSVVKYTTATAPADPSFESGKVFVGWFYLDGDTEKAFSFAMPITHDYDLYPKWSEKVNVNYTVHYYLAGTTTKLAKDKSGTALIGSTVTEKAKVGDELDLAEGDTSYFPQATSTSVRLVSADTEIIFYYAPATSLAYTVRYVDEDDNDLLDPAKKTTSLSTVVEQYVAIEGWTPLEFQKSLDLSTDSEKNVITFVYRQATMDLTIHKQGAKDDSEAFLFAVVGADGTSRTVAIQGNGTAVIRGLKVQVYTVTEQTDWSWRYQTLAPQTADSLHRELTFTNVKTNDHWLSGCANAINDFTGKAPSPAADNGKGE